MVKLFLMVIMMKVLDFFRQLFGDGVLFLTNGKAKYIDFCIDNSKKTVFDFGIILTDEQ